MSEVTQEEDEAQAQDGTVDGGPIIESRRADVVTGSKINTLALPQLEIEHLFQEYHEEAATSAYTGPRKADRRVVEQKDKDGKLLAKKSLHLCFLERAMATFKARIPKTGTYFASWQILDDQSKVVAEHKDMSAANLKATKAAAVVRTGRYGWMWDGRQGPKEKKVFAKAGTYKSQLVVHNKAGKEMHRSEASIELEGDPYKIYVRGRPKEDDELLAEFKKRNGRFLSKRGYRTAKDCWMWVWRGLFDKPGHAVFLGEGAIEATKHAHKTKYGAVGTPPGRDYKGWVRYNPTGKYAKADRIQIQDVGGTNIALSNPGGPAPNNPFSSSGGAEKDGVQAHAGRRVWVSEGMSIGCTTVSAVSGGTPAKPGSQVGEVRSMESSFGSWGGQKSFPKQGPTFVNKQNKRDDPDDALLEDSHTAPELKPEHPSEAEPDEPLHMQDTLQKGTFGGFYRHEIPRGSRVKDEPTNQLRIRVQMEEFVGGSLYEEYHRAVIFGHSWEADGANVKVWIWIPRKIMRGWNGNFRNLRVHKECEMSWYVEHRLTASTMGPPQPAVGLHPDKDPDTSWVNVPGKFYGRRDETWKPDATLAAGEYYSVFRYRIELKPYTTGTDEWVPEAASNDLFTTDGATGGAKRLAEKIVKVGSKTYLQGQSELLLRTVP